MANRSVNLPLASPSLHRDVLTDALSDAAAWLLGAGLFGTVAAWLSGRFGSAWTLVCRSAALTVMLAATLIWGAHDLGYITPNTSALDLLHRRSSSWHAVGWQSRPFGLLATDDVLGRLELTSTTRGPARRGPPPLFTAPLLPAGEYEVTLAGRLRPEGRLTATIGRAGPSIDVIALAEAGHGADGLVIRLPVRVHSLTIEGDARARETIDRLALRPRRVRDGDRPESGKALRAARYGAVRAFFLDDNAFVEPPGFWTRGEAATNLIVDTDALTGATNDPQPVLTLRAGAVATGVRLSSGGWVRTLSLEAGELQSVVLTRPGPSGVWPLRIETGPGFRPAVHEPGSRDFRNLGVWVEFPGASAALESAAGLTPPESGQSSPPPMER